AVDLLSGLKGRIVISGMGKSGHIAKKIAATLASTGSPAMFVHPAEASHGDLGMITEQDAVLLLSNSGETPELGDMINYTKRFKIPLLALVRREKSMLVEAADVAFVLPEVPEASPTGAPTTSTTMMLAWGDALAMALLHRRGFTKEDFGVLHPGGKLGKAFLRVEQIMRSGKDLPVVAVDAVMADVLLVMTAKSLGCAVVVDTSGNALGIITDGDLRRHMEGNLLTATAQNVMTASPKAILPSQLASEALGIMNRLSVTSLCVVDHTGKLVGMVHIHDVLRAGVA
ncbi:MAG: KpsF/GutQ family sugar-phosphate isomerase, partial [Rickettsiales bacterium]|nr:KpsF/GutQ family sugar-phosphate isomerase [Rickettsiales bacterium]